MSSHRFANLRVYLCIAAVFLGIQAESGELLEEDTRADCPASYRRLDGEGFTAILVGCEAQVSAITQDALEPIRRVLELRAGKQDLGPGLIEEINRIVTHDPKKKPISCVYLDLGTRTKVLVNRTSDLSGLEVSGESVDAVIFGGGDHLTALSRDEVGMIVKELEAALNEQGMRLLGKEDTPEWRRYLSQRINNILREPVVEDIFLRRYSISEPL